VRARLYLLVFVCGCDAADFAEAGVDAASSDGTLADVGSTFGDGYYEVSQPGPPPPLPPPHVDCIDGGDAGMTCPLPGSVCATGQWLEYFDNGVCVDGGCQFDTQMHQCVSTNGGFSYCSDGGCVYIGPTAAPNL
jgi:hypothetical protein